DAARARNVENEMTREENLQVWRGEVGDTASQPGTERESDFALAQRASKGDARAFEEIYRLHYRRVYGLCLRMTQNVAEAEDITQEVFILLHRKAGTVRGASQCKTWLYHVTSNEVIKL